MRSRSFTWLSVLLVACTFPEVDTTGLDTGSTATTSSSTSSDTPTTTTTGDPTTGSTSSTGDGGAPSTTSSTGDGGAATTGGGSTSDGGGGGSTTQSTSSTGGGAGGNPCPEGCTLSYGWEADGCSAYGAGDCPAYTYEGADAPSCGEPASLRECEAGGIVLGTCNDVGNPISVTATCGPAE